MSGDNLSEARALAERGDWVAAAERCQQHLRRQPRDTDAWTVLGELALKSGQPETAVACLTRTLEAGRNDAAFLGLFTCAHRALGRLDAAAASLEWLLDSHGPTVPLYHELGRVHAAGGRPGPAEKYLRQACRLAGPGEPATTSLGLLLLQQERWGEAFTLFKTAAQAAPAEADHWNNAGVAARALGRAETAAAYHRQACVLRPGCADFHANLAIVLVESGQAGAALEACRIGLELHPLAGGLHFHHGNALALAGQPGPAAAAYRQCLQLDAGFIPAWLNLATAAGGHAAWPESLECCDQVLRLQPGLAEAHHLRGIALRQLDRRDDAIASFRTATELRTDYAEAWNNLGVACGEQDHHEAGIAACRRATELQPDFAEYHYNLGNVLNAAGHLPAAQAAYRRTLDLQPGHARALNNLGVVNQELGSPTEAIALLERAAVLQPSDAGVRLNLACALLLAGRYAEGWAAYEARAHTPEFAPRTFPFAAWTGDDPGRRRLLVHSEQGFGDTLQFVRYTRCLHERGARVILQCQPALVRLLRGCRWLEQVVGEGEPVPACDAHVPLLSLPRLLGLGPYTGPVWPYLTAEPGLVAGWRQILATRRLKVGLAWQGNPKNRRDRQRSFPLTLLAPLADVPGIELLSLQRGPGAEQLAGVPFRARLIDLSDQLAGFAPTAAAITQLDLVVGCDSALAHLSGALNVPTWLALPFVPDWRWGLADRTTPWYPSMELFRQRDRGDWPPVFAEIAGRLAALAATHQTVTSVA